MALPLPHNNDDDIPRGKGRRIPVHDPVSRPLPEAAFYEDWMNSGLAWVYDPIDMGRESLDQLS
jgi:hypothetical protein